MEANIQPRSYTGYKDLEHMRDLLVAGRKSANGSYYVHTGDLNWWLFYTYPEQALWEYIYLWESPQRDGALDGWALLNPQWRTFDVFVDPALRGSGRAEKMYTWSEERAAKIAASQGKNEICTIWILADDHVLVKHFKIRGFERDQDYHIYMTRLLDEDLPQIVTPDGYQVRDMHNENEVEQRAATSYAAFQSSIPWERYLERYRRFRVSPVYNPRHDLAMAAPDGRLASFCLFWLDVENRVGLFEPVGTHPDFQRLGLGKAVMLEGLRRMREAGMRKAIVQTDHDNSGALNLYQSLEFKEENRLYAYTKKLEFYPARGHDYGG